MPITTLPAIDQSSCAQWTLQDTSLYNALPYYFALQQVKRRPMWKSYEKFVGSIDWQENQGQTLRAVIPESSPHLRQQFTPNQIWTEPATDLVQALERTKDATPYWHDFETPVFTWSPSFKDFLNNKIKVHNDDLVEKMERAQDLFLRTHMFHQAPRVWCCGGVGGGYAPQLIETAPGLPNIAGTTGKTAAIRTALMNTATTNLTVPEILRLVNVMQDRLGVMPYKGSALPGSNGLSFGICIVLSEEAFSNLAFDPWWKGNVGDTFNIAEKGFQGNIMGRVTFMIERFPMRLARDGTLPAPETIELDPNADNYRETTINADYAVNTTHEVAFAFGDVGYKALKLGPPPKEFQGKGIPEGFGKMTWNGEIQLTKNLLIPCTDINGNAIQKTNSKGRYLRLEATQYFGAIGVKSRNVIPIMFKRQFGPTEA